MNKEYSFKTGKQIPIVDETAVLVVGGGTTGIAAALAAARTGADTLLLEYNGFLGGNAMTGLPWLGFHNRERKRIIGGIPMEFVRDLWKLDAATSFYFDPITGSCIGINTAVLELLIMRKITESKVITRLNSLFLGIESHKSGNKKIIFADRAGVKAILARIVIDCTDSGEAAGKAGARSVFGREKDGKAQAASYTCCFSNIDYSRLFEYFRKNPDQIRPFKLKKEEINRLLKQMENAEIYVLGAFEKLVKQAAREGLELARENIPSVVIPKFNYMVSVATRLLDVDPNMPEKFTAATLEGARQAGILLQFYKKYVPGCENIQLIRTPSTLGIRETRHTSGEYMLTSADLMRGKAFADGIALGNYHLDIHSPDHKGLETRQPKTYQIPYRSLLPKGIRGVLIAGRALSATHGALASLRVIPICMAVGQAAGTAAALASRNRVALLDLSIEKLRGKLKQDGAYLSPADCPRHE